MEKLQANGEGTETWADGAVYQGHFKDGKKEGLGKFYGQIRRNMKGTSTTTTKKARDAMCGVMVYEGGWRNNRMHGFERFVWPDGKTYEGR